MDDANGMNVQSVDKRKKKLLRFNITSLNRPNSVKTNSYSYNKRDRFVNVKSMIPTKGIIYSAF